LEASFVQLRPRKANAEVIVYTPNPEFDFGKRNLEQIYKLIAGLDGCDFENFLKIEFIKYVFIFFFFEEQAKQSASLCIIARADLNIRSFRRAENWSNHACIKKKPEIVCCDILTERKNFGGRRV